MSGLLSMLACPRDHQALEVEGRFLACAAGHRYPVVEGVPVLLVEEDAPTIGIATTSLDCAKRHADGEEPEDAWFTSTLGISRAEVAELLAQVARGDSGIDPVMRFLVGATNGILYRDLVGRIDVYPIPELRLPTGEGRALLDVGCSWGRWSLAAARKGYRVVGIDPSLGAVLAARRIASDLGLTADFVVGDARRLPFFECQFSTVFSYSVLQHFEKAAARASIREVGRVLVASGESLVQMPNRLGLRCLYQQARRGFRPPMGFEVRYWSLTELQQAFEEGIGATRLSVDCFFGIGLQPSDAHLMPRGHRALLSASESLREHSAKHGWLRTFADSLYVRSTRRPTPGASA